MAAGVILTGGLAGGVLLAPGAAYAADTTTTTVTATAQGSAINVAVSVTSTTGSPTGRVDVSDGTGGCHINLGFGSSCDITNVAAGTYTVTATYEGDGGFSSSSASQTGVVVAGTPTPTPTGGSAPVFSADSPPSSVDAASFSYQFQASGSPSFQLVGAPSWLSIDGSGMVSGTIPDASDSFTFSVYAWNSWGHLTLGPFTVFYRHHHHHHNNFAEVNLHTHLYCTSPVYTGGHGSCTLWVTNENDNFPWSPNNYYGQNNNFGQDFASDVIAQISLPFPLRAFCGYGYFSSGCRNFGNSVTEDLGNIYPGQTKSLTVNFTVRGGFSVWGYHPGHSFYVKVVGSASSEHSHFFFTGDGESTSVAYVKIIPRGFWW
jgi:Bacterial Ig-like domain (group 3)